MFPRNHRNLIDRPTFRTKKAVWLCRTVHRNARTTIREKNMQDIQDNYFECFLVILST